MSDVLKHTLRETCRGHGESGENAHDKAVGLARGDGCGFDGKAVDF